MTKLKSQSLKLRITSRRTKPIKTFDHEQWPLYNKAHFHRSDVPWDSKKYFIAAYDGKIIVGTLELRIKGGGVANIHTLIVRDTHHRAGVGSRLVEQAVTLAQQENCHKIILTTGREWDSVPFYEKLGFTKTADLKDHFFHIDFIELTKWI